MPEQGTWRISTAYDYVNELDAPDLAWEFLRRNPEYQKDYARLTAADTDDQVVRSEIADHWGLSFRHRSRPAGTCGKCALDADGGPRDARPGGLADVAVAILVICQAIPCF